MRVHAFLEQQGVINYNAMSQRGVILKPQSQFLLKESNYEHVLINLANKHNLTRHEDELASNMFIRDVNTQKIVG